MILPMMSPKRGARLGFGLALTLGLWIAPPPAHAGDITDRPSQLRDVGIDQHPGIRLPTDLRFNDDRGESRPLSSFFGGRPLVLSFAYFECPMLCTVALNELTSSFGVLPLEMGRDFDALTISFDPRDTPAVAAERKRTLLERYKRPGGEVNWNFLTGDAESIRQITQAAGFRFSWDETQKQYAHSAGIMILTPDGKISRYLFGVEIAPRDLRLALVEASAGRIGNVVDQLLLFCFHYDPATGRYSLVAWNTLRVASALTVLLLGSFIFVMVRRESRQASLATTGAS